MRQFRGDTMKTLFSFLWAGHAEANQPTEGGVRVLIDKKLYEFYGPEDGTPPEIQIVFFHGLEPRDSGNAYLDTWKSSDGSTLWPKRWLPENFKNARILSVSYDSSAIQGQKMGNLDLYCTAESLIQDLTDLDVGVTIHESCPFVMVGKDLGCLVIEAVCLHAKQRKNSTFLNNLKGFVFYCPATMGLPDFPKSFGGKLAQNLRWGDTEIARLNSAFFKLKGKKEWVMKVMIAANRAPNGELLKYVPEASARYGADNFYSASEDIRSICRPRTNKSESYVYLKNLISHCLTSNGQAVRMRFQVPFKDDRRYVPLEGTIREIRSSFRESRIVVLHGDAGSGKSSLARCLALRLQQESFRGGNDRPATADANTCFPDGILYLCCGHGAQVVSIQDELLRLINPRHREEYRPDFLVSGLRESDHQSKYRSKILAQDVVQHLGPLQGLLIVDDVWDSDILEGLLVPGVVKYLVTTQDHMLARKFSDSSPIKIEPIPREVAHHILANYAGLKDGLVPSHLEAVANNLMTKTDSNPLSLATLGMAVSASRRDLLDEWQELECLFLDLLGDEDNRPALYDREYHSSVLVSMMLAMRRLTEDVQKLLHVIVLFDGPKVHEDLIRLFLDCMPLEESLKGNNAPSKLRKLFNRGLVERWEVGIEEKWMISDIEKRTAWSIHSLRRHAILTLKKAEIREVTNFLDGEFLRGGIKSDYDLATSLCALYGESDCRQKASERMGNRYIWIRQEFASLNKNELALSLTWLMPVMLLERNACDEKSTTKKSAEEVFWNVFIKCELDGAGIACLLNNPHYAYWTCLFLYFFNWTFLETDFRFSVHSSDTLIKKLVSLTNSEVVHRISPSNARKRPRENVVIARFPESLNKIIQRSVILLSTLAIFDSVTDGLACPQSLNELPPGVKRFIWFTADVELRNQVEVATTIPDIGFTAGTLLRTLPVPLCLRRIVRLLAADMEYLTRALATIAIARLACIKAVAMMIVQVPLCLKRIVRLLAEKEPLLQRFAAAAIGNLAYHPESRLAIAKVSRCLEMLVRLLPENQEPGVREFAVLIIGRLYFDGLAGLPEANVRPSFQEQAANMQRNVQEDVVEGISFLTLTSLVSLHARIVRPSIQEYEENMQRDTQELVVRAICNLAEPEDNVAFAQVPSCLKKLGIQLRSNVRNIQELAIRAIWKLACEPGNSLAIARVSVCLENLVNLLAVNVPPNIQQMGIAALMTLAFEPKNRVGIARVPLCLESLVSFLATNDNLGSQGFALIAICELTKEPENRAAIARVPFCLARLVNLLATDRTQRGAVVAICKLALEPENRVAIPRVPLCLEGLVNLLATNVDPDIQEFSLQAIKDLASITENRVAIGKAPLCLERLVSLLAENVDPNIQKLTVQTIGYLAFDQENRMSIARVPLCFERLVGLLAGNRPPEIQKLAVQAICHLTCELNIRMAIAEVPLYLERLVSLLAPDVQPIIQNHAVRAICNLACEPENRVAIATVPLCLERLVSLLAASVQPSIQEVGVLTIMKLASESENRMPIVQVPLCVERLVSLLGTNGKPNIQKWALKAIAELACEQESKVAIARVPLCLETLVACLKQNVQLSIQTLAVEVIDSLADEPKNCVAIAQVPSCVERLVSLLEANVDPNTHLFAVRAIAGLGCDSENGVIIAQVPYCVEGLVNLLAANVEPIIQESAALAVGNLASVPRNRVAIAKVPSCLARLVDLLAANDTCQEFAVGALQNLTCEPENCLAIAQVPLCLERLVTLLATNVEPNLQMCAVGALQNLTFEPENRVAIAQVPVCLENLVRLLDANVDPSMQELAIGAIANLVCIKENSLAIAQVPLCLERLVNFLAANESPSIQELAAQAIGELACDLENRTAIAQSPSCLENLVGLLAANVMPNIQELALRAIGNLALDLQSRESIAKVPSCLEGLVDMLTENVDPNIQKWAVTVIGYLALEQENKVAIAKVPLCLDRLVSLLAAHVEASIQKLAAQAIGYLAFEMDNRMAIAQVPFCLERLVSLLAVNEEPSIQEAACSTIHELAREPENRMTIVQVPWFLERLVGLLTTDMSSNRQKLARWTLCFMGDHDRHRGSVEDGETSWEGRPVGMGRKPGDIPQIRAASPSSINSIRGEILRLVRDAGGPKDVLTELFSWWSFKDAQRKDFQSAIVMIDEALDLDKDNGFVWQERGVLRRLMGDLSGALEDLNRALEIDPDDYEVLKHRALVRYSLRDDNGASADAERALQVQTACLDEDSYASNCFGMLPVQFLDYNLRSFHIGTDTRLDFGAVRKDPTSLHPASTERDMQSCFHNSYGFGSVNSFSKSDKRSTRIVALVWWYTRIHIVL